MPGGAVLLLRAFGRNDLAFRLQLPDGGSQEASELQGQELESFLEAVRVPFRPFFAWFRTPLASFWHGLSRFLPRFRKASGLGHVPKPAEQEALREEEVVGVSEAPKCLGSKAHGVTRLIISYNEPI